MNFKTQMFILGGNLLTCKQRGRQSRKAFLRWITGSGKEALAGP